VGGVDGDILAIYGMGVGRRLGVQRMRIRTSQM
jgi:hypothetical protein